MKICMSSGHSTKCQGASDILNEVEEATDVVDRTAELLRASGVECETFHDTVSNDQSENLNRITDWHNAQTRDWDVSVHFNAYEHTSKPMGTECLYVSSTGEGMAKKVADAIASVGFINRGPKKRTDLHFLNQTEEPAVLVEVCFVDSVADANLYDDEFEAVCSQLAGALAGEAVQPGPEPEPPPVTEAGWHDDITATVFGGSGEIQESAYGGMVDSTKPGVALPWKWRDSAPPMIRVEGPDGVVQVCPVVDVGPWMIDDDAYVLGSARSIAEQCYEDGRPLPSGPNAGQVPTNDAGIDLTEHTAAFLGIEGKGVVRWQIDQGEAVVPPDEDLEARVEDLEATADDHERRITALERRPQTEAAVSVQKKPAKKKKG